MTSSDANKIPSSSKRHQRDESLPDTDMQGMGLVPSMAIFGAASLALILETRYLIPFLSETSGQEPVVFWFIVAGLGLFTPQLIVSAVLLKNEGVLFRPGFWNRRQRFRRMHVIDWLWCIGAVIVIGLTSKIIMDGIGTITGQFDRSPPFMAFEPLTPQRYWILALWLPYWILNIMGEEILWRGVMLPRQEIAFGKKTWMIHGLGWAFFHVAFGWQHLLTLLPILFILSYVVQRRKNTWIGVIIHATINGPAFIAIAFGKL